MKKLILSAVVAFTTIVACAQTSENTESSVMSDAAVYQLFPTQNMWTFIKLNTRNGRMWQVQYTIDDDDSRFETYFNLIPLVSKEEEVNGRFTLYPTTNFYNFILLDRLDGRVWQAQWSTKADERGIIPIENIMKL